jgi:hypothetical protein
MSVLLNNPILMPIFFAFWITILWAVVTVTKTLQRIATSFELLLVRQKEERVSH